jgi:putative transposase
MVSRSMNDGMAGGNGIGGPSRLEIPPQTVEVILGEIRAGGDLTAVARKYGVLPETVARWQATKEGPPTAGEGPGEQPGGPAAVSRTTGRYTKAFKDEVLAQVNAGRRKVEVATQYGIPETSVYRWLRQAAANGGAMPDAKSTRPLSNASPINDEHRALVLELKKAHPKMGPAQIQNQLRRFHAVKMGRHLIGRIFAEAGIPLQKPSGVKDGSDPADNRFEMSRPNELWAVDFKEFWIHAEKVYGLFVLDHFSRFCVGHALTQTPTAELAIETVNAAIQRYGRPERILSDRGPQFHSWNGVSRFDAFLGDFFTDHTVTRAGHCWTNGKIEAFNRTIEEELLDMEELASLKDAEIRVRGFVSEYNFLRTHMGIAGLIPADRYFGMVAEAQQALMAGLTKAGPGLKWLRGLVSQDGPGLRHPTFLQVLLRDGKLELVVLGQRFKLG